MCTYSIRPDSGAAISGRRVAEQPVQMSADPTHTQLWFWILKYFFLQGTFLPTANRLVFVAFPCFCLFCPARRQLGAVQNPTHASTRTDRDRRHIECSILRTTTRRRSCGSSGRRRSRSAVQPWRDDARTRVGASPRSDTVAGKWYTRAAEQGHASARCNLGVMRKRAGCTAERRGGAQVVNEGGGAGPRQSILALQQSHWLVCHTRNCCCCCFGRRRRHHSR